MTLILTIIFFILGLIIGSFLNVVIYRLNTARSLGGRSACMSCQSKLSWYELIPVFSFLGLRGRCKSCKTKISIQYPLVEFITGLVFALLFAKLQAEYDFFSLAFLGVYAYYAVTFSLLLVIAVYDLRHKIIPDSLVFIFCLFAFLGLFFIHTPGLLEFLAGPLIALPFALFWLISGGRWMGLGDAKLALGIGWLLGLSLAFSSLVIAFWSGAAVGLSLIVFSRLDSARLAKNYGMKSEIPFAPYLVLGAFLAFIFDLRLFPL
ncbi:hypothetical protein A2W67_02365 [Candidatus Nomurabacteria bacterium RIFCSPLOWO2_02_40_28]|uniref:Peptidase A24A domain protein n=2 Tax=Candidatus Nomuraibacteriota TaxID=1752729 RepID=A0A837HUC0_9BACT|nr:MAG: Peptidase A24A domain protein [Candidatus Nomurabacteria bacterium GW2011_GWD2_39_12]KKR20512.1 MAG: Peptidase A24A domain protein [Candidatus Nomurabacteria bacterium GW2011_GWC2_39_41]KKR36737.1 MAG: Peptidase A24A domain protein [Candidatus Nomurabacteria bacterium GW2011_GWE2_40_10]KKR38462.1 MAG: Peptidase A24A domain protein [Candidatus Nomurabacteria bacterium GW2011_GWB1_40_11]KKR39570.1 MAG: Peptidase A24A domain protein [Parcubacteria group bacterium GW2011_GWC1_40_11]KKR5910